MHAAIARGVPRYTAIAQALKSGVTYNRIGKEFGLSRQRVHQIVLSQEALASISPNV
jgi:DNA-directed RNA polymerase sigma subunit (sigma70/sigma32)